MGEQQPRAPVQAVAAPSHQDVLGEKGERRRGGVSSLSLSLSLPAAVPERRGLHEAGAGKDGGDAEDDEGADVHDALPRLLVGVLRSVYSSRRKISMCGTGMYVGIWPTCTFAPAEGIQKACTMN